MNNLNADAVDAEIEATKRELTDIMNVDSPLRDRVRGEMGMDGIQRAVHAVIRLQTRMHALKATAALAEPAPVVAARDAYADQMNLELRQSIAANVLEAMDVDQYLIDAVRNAVPAESADEWARLDGANADEDTRARLTELLSTSVFHCFNGRKLGLSAMQAMAVADALVSAGARFDEVAS